VLLELSPGDGPDSLARILGVALVGQIVLSGFFYLAYLALGRYSWSDAWWVIVLILGTGAALRALMLVWGLDVFGLPDNVSLLTRMVNSLALIPITFVLALRGMEYLQSYRLRRNGFINLLVEADQQLSQQVVPFDESVSSAEAAAQRDLGEVNHQVVASLTNLKADLQSGLVQGYSLGSLREQADSQWRTLSHSLHDVAEVRLPRISIQEFVDTVAQSRPLSLRFLAVGGGFLFAIALVRVFPFVEAVGWALGWFALMALYSLALNEIPRRLPYPGWSFALLFLPYAFGGAVFLIAPGVTAGSGWGAAGVHFTVAVSMVLLGMGPAISRSQDIVLSALRTQLDARSLRRLQVESNRSILIQKFAERLHSHVRGSFHAGMMRLQQCIDEGRIDDAAREVDLLVDALLEKPIPSSASTTLHDAHEFLRHWDGLVSISSNLEGVLVPPKLEEAVATIVINAVNDAVRHGNAETIDVTFQIINDQPRLVITNDGQSAETAGPDGLGSAALERFALGSWERRQCDDDRTQLSVTFASQSRG